MQLTAAQKALQASYAAAARRYAHWIVPRFRPLVRELLVHPAPPAGPGLDVGSGTGLVLDEWRRLAPDAWLVAYDLTREMLTNGLGQPNGRIIGDAAALPFAAGSFQAVVSAFLLHHLPRLEPLFAGCHRILRPGGELRVVCWGEHPLRPDQPLAGDPATLFAALGLPPPPRAPTTPRPPDTAANLVELTAAAGFSGVHAEARAVTLVFRDALACWRWWSAFPGMAAILAPRSRAERAALRDRFCAHVGAYPPPLTSTLEVLYLRARRP